MKKLMFIGLLALVTSGVNANISIDHCVGETRIFDGSMDGKIEIRSNGGVVMFDRLVSPAPAAGTIIFVKNQDAVSLEEIRAQSGVSLDGVSDPCAYRVIGPGQTGTFVSDGANWFSLNMPVRVKFAADTIMYADVDHGDDCNSGISASAAKRTLQVALNELFMGYDMAGNRYILQLADSLNHYSGFQIRGTMTGHYGYPAIFGEHASFTVTGNISNPTQVVIDGGTASAAVDVQVGKSLHLDGVTLQSGVSSGVLAELPGTEIVLHNVNFGPCAGPQIYASNQATVLLDARIDIYGDSPEFIYADSVSSVTYTGTPSAHFHGARSYSGFVVGAARNSTVSIQGLVWVIENGASVTGQRWKTLLNGVVDVGHVNPDMVIPGTINGSNNYGGESWWP